MFRSAIIAASPRSRIRGPRREVGSRPNRACAVCVLHHQRAENNPAGAAQSVALQLAELNPMAGASSSESGSSASEHGGARDGRRAPSVHDTLRVLGRAEAVLVEVTAAKKSLQATFDAARAARGTAA